MVKGKVDGTELSLFGSYDCDGWYSEHGGRGYELCGSW